MKKITAIKARTLWQQTKGLLGTTKAHPLLLKTRWGIHTFGMKYPIDIVVLDKENKVVKIKEKLQPNHFFVWNPKYNRILELPKGFVGEKKIMQEDQISLEILD
jgi:uncharacterized membrane protein (UPF0127 family)